MRKLTFAVAVLASLGGAALTQSASAAPAMPIGMSGLEAVTPVRMDRMEHRMMHRRMERRMMRRHMERRMMHRHMRHRMMRHHM